MPTATESPEIDSPVPCVPLMPVPQGIDRPPERPRRSLRERLAATRAALAFDDVTRVMLRREAAGCVVRPQGRQSLVIGMCLAIALALLIPVHRIYGNTGRLPYFALYALGIQVAMAVLAARAVWSSLRRDAAQGSLDELRLTGCAEAKVLLGRWIGAGLAGMGWSLVLTPGLVLAGAVTGRDPREVPLVVIGWSLAAMGGALVGSLSALSTRGSAGSGAGVALTLQFWFLFRFLSSRGGAGLGPAGVELVRACRALDPLFVIPAAIGLAREPFGLKVLVCLLLFLMAAVWLAGADVEIPSADRLRPQQEPGRMLSLRPLRAWVTGRRQALEPMPEHGALARFESRHGWRLRLSPPALVCLLGASLLPLPSLMILGKDGTLGAAVLATSDLCLAALIAGFGAAAAVTGEREQGRWTFLLCAPISFAELVGAKWRAAWVETLPIWIAAAVRAVALGLTGAVTPAGAALALLVTPVVAGAAAALSTALAVGSPSLAVSQQRTAVLLLLPVIAGGVATLLLPALSGLAFLSWPQIVLTNLLRPPTAPGYLPVLILLMVTAACIPAALGVATWQLRRTNLT